jgi:hypothetical protein
VFYPITNAVPHQNHKIQLYFSKQPFKARPHNQKNLDSYSFVTSVLLFPLKKDVNVALKSNKQKNREKNHFLLSS